MFVSGLASSIKGSATIALNAKAQQLRLDGKKVFNFTVGEPDFNAFENAKEAAIKAVRENKSRYTAADGLLDLKNAIVEKLKSENGLDYSSKQIIVSNGGKQALYNIFLAILNKDDEVLIPKPAWLSYKEQIFLAGGKTIFVESDKNFQVSADSFREKISPKTKAILVNSPSNPTGSVLKKSELKKIADLVVEKNLLVVSDECYEHFVYDGVEQVSIASFGKEIYDLAITCNTVSKTYAMTGWRIGYTAASESIIKAMANIQSHTTGNPCNLAQYAAIEAFKTPKELVEERKNAFDKRRKIVVKAFNEMNGVKLAEPKGAFYAFPYMNELYNDKVKNSTELCNYLLEKANALFVPGIEFEEDKCIRMSYATAESEIIEGLEKTKKALDEL